MKHITSDIAFTPTVKAVQERLGSRKAYAKMEQRDGWRNEVTPELAAFIVERDSFYLGTASQDGQPYIQHRGGPKGFLRVVDERTLAFADFKGNRQYISMGNLTENNKAILFLMDYPNRQRIKIWGQMEVIEDDQELIEKLVNPAYAARPERIFRFRVEAWDANCPQHITPRYTQAEIEPGLQAFRDRIAELETEVVELRAHLERGKGAHPSEGKEDEK